MKQSNPSFLSTLALLTLIGAVALPQAAQAQSVTLPGAAAGTLTSVRQFSTTAAAYQVVYSSTLLSSVPLGAQITGIQFRLASTPTQPNGPASGLSFTSYNITLSKSLNAPGSLSTTFASNIASDQVAVRSGALTIAANSYTGGTSPNPFGPTISFSTPYTYTGGNLLMTLNHGTGTGTALTMDAYTNSGASYQGIQATSQNATVGAAGNTIVSKFLYSVSTSAPEPGTLALLALGGVAVLAKRRRRS